MSKPLTAKKIVAELAKLPGWACEHEALAKTFEFADFRDALAFMVRAGFEAEALNHHPEWMNVFDLLPALKSRDSLKQPACKAGGSVEGWFPLHRSLKLLHGQWRQVLPTLYSERRSHRHGRSERT